MADIIGYLKLYKLISRKILRGWTLEKNSSLSWTYCMLVSLQRNERLSRLKCKKFWKKFKKKKSQGSSSITFYFAKNPQMSCTHVSDARMYSMTRFYIPYEQCTQLCSLIAKNVFSKNQQRDWNSSKSRRHCKAMMTFFLFCKRIHIFVSFRQCRMIVCSLTKLFSFEGI